MRAIEGDFEVRPGVRVITTPGRTPGSQSVLVNTGSITYALVGSLAYDEMNWSQPKPIGDALDVVQWHRSLNRLMFSGATILPTHTDAVYQRESYG